MTCLRSTSPDMPLRGLLRPAEPATAGHGTRPLGTWQQCHCWITHRHSPALRTIHHAVSRSVQLRTGI